jgi:hypothetical protein
MASAACNTIPPVVVDSYTPNGGYIELAGLRTCMYLLLLFPLSHTNPPPDITGSQTSTKAIVDVHDIFGLAPQTLQGADLLATTLNAVVLVPDFLGVSRYRERGLLAAKRMRSLRLRGGPSM